MTKKEALEAKMKEREDFIVSILKEDPAHSVSGKSIEDACEIKPGNRQVYMKKLMKKYPQIQNVGKKEAEYKWVEDKAPVSKKNSEGYHDPTPQKAIENTLSTLDSIKIHPGEIWSATEANGSTQPIFILNTLNGAAQCIKLYPESSENIKIIGPDYFRIDIYGISHIGDPSHVTFKPLRYLTRKLVDAPESKLSEVRWYLSMVFGITKEKKEDPDVSKIEDELQKKQVRISNLEAEVEDLKDQLENSKNCKAPEGYVDAKTAQIMVLTEERDIWKTVALKLLGGA